MLTACPPTRFSLICTQCLPMLGKSMLFDQKHRLSSGPHSSPSDCSAARQLHTRLRLGLFVVVAVYAAMYLLGFLASPSGRFAMLDGAENMDLAGQIATGTLPPV